MKVTAYSKLYSFLDGTENKIYLFSGHIFPVPSLRHIQHVISGYFNDLASPSTYTSQPQYLLNQVQASSNSTSTTMFFQSFRETRNELVSRLTTVHHRLRNQHLPLTIVAEYLLEIITDLNMLKQKADTELYPPDQGTHTCCIHRLTQIQVHLREQALLLRDYPQGERSQKGPAIFYPAVEMTAVQIGRCVVNSHPDRDAAHMGLTAIVINANL